MIRVFDWVSLNEDLPRGSKFKYHAHVHKERGSIYGKQSLTRTATMPFSLDTPLSLYSIPFAWYTAFYPMNVKVRLMICQNLDCGKRKGLLNPFVVSSVSSKRRLVTTSEREINKKQYVFNSDGHYVASSREQIRRG